MKYLVETMGDYALHDLVGGQTLMAHRPTVVTPTPFIEMHKGRRLRVLLELADEATDASLYLAKGVDEIKAAIRDLPRLHPEDEPAPAKRAPGRQTKG